MNSIAFFFSALSVSSSLALAQFYDLSESSPSRVAQEGTANTNFVHPNIDARAIVEEVAREENERDRRGVGGSKIGDNKNRIRIYIDNMDDLDEHTVEEIAEAVRVAGYYAGYYHEDMALTVHMKREMDGVRQTMAKNRLRKALKIALKDPIDRFRGGHGASSEDVNAPASDNDDKNYSIADRVVDSVRIDGNKMQFKIYSDNTVDSNRDVNVVQQVGRKTYLQLRYNRNNVNHRLHYGVGIDVARKTEQGESDSGLVFYVGGKFTNRFHLVKYRAAE